MGYNSAMDTPEGDAFAREGVVLATEVGASWDLTIKPTPNKYDPVDGMWHLDGEDWAWVESVIRPTLTMPQLIRYGDIYFSEDQYLRANSWSRYAGVPWYALFELRGNPGGRIYWQVTNYEGTPRFTPRRQVRPSVYTDVNPRDEVAYVFFPNEFMRRVTGTRPEHELR